MIIKFLFAFLLLFLPIDAQFRELYTFGSGSFISSGMDPSTPKIIPEMNNVKEIFQCNERNSFILKQDGSLYAFGQNNVRLNILIFSLVN